MSERFEWFCEAHSPPHFLQSVSSPVTRNERGHRIFIPYQHEQDSFLFKASFTVSTFSPSLFAIVNSKKDNSSHFS